MTAPISEAARYPDLAGKVAFVTGGASGIGLAVCELLAEQGCKVAVADIDEAAGLHVAKQLTRGGYQARFLTVDVASPGSITSAIEVLLHESGPVDIAVNCAGVMRRADVLTLGEAEWDHIIAVNLKSTFLVSRAVVPGMRRKGGGAIVNVASGWGLVGGKQAAAYCAAKGGVVLLSKAMALDHGPENIRVNCVCPGDTHTPMLINEAQQLGLAADALIQAGSERPLGRIGNPREIASVITFLAASASSFMTGSVVVVDGGGLAGTM